MACQGIDADLAAKAALNYDHGLEKEVCDWIEKISGEVKGDLPVEEWLHDGKVLCKFANCVHPGAVKKINEQKMPFKQMENIKNFTDFARSSGVSEFQMFATGDLYENKNMGSVMKCLFAFGGAIQVSHKDFNGPHLGHAQEAHDGPRKKAVATQSGGLTGALEVQHQGGGREIAANHDAPKGAHGGGGYAAAGTEASAAAGAPGSTRADVASLDDDLKAKQDSKHDDALEKEVVDWLVAVSGMPKGDESVQEWLKNGKVLCATANAIKPGVITKVSNLPGFHQMENITHFIDFARDTGVPESAVFGTPSLYENKDMNQVVQTIYTFGGAVQVKYPEFKGPKLGVPLHVSSADHKREGLMCTDQNEAMQRAMQKEKPKDGGIIR